MGDAFDGYLLFAHCLEQRGLSLGRGTVDFVGQHDLRHYRAGPVLELAGLLVEYRGAGNVAWQQVGGELQPFEITSGSDGD